MFHPAMTPSQSYKLTLKKPRLAPRLMSQAFSNEIAFDVIKILPHGTKICLGLLV